MASGTIVLGKILGVFKGYMFKDCQTFVVFFFKGEKLRPVHFNENISLYYKLGLKHDWRFSNEGKFVDWQPWKLQWHLKIAFKNREFPFKLTVGLIIFKNSKIICLTTIFLVVLKEPWARFFGLIVLEKIVLENSWTFF